MQRIFLYLAGLTSLSLLLLWLFAARDGSSIKPFASDVLLPEISKQINDVDSVEIVSAGNNTVATMVRTSEQWQLEQMDGYQADWSSLQTLLADLAQATIVETKTDNPAYYSRLGVEDIAAEDAGGVLVRVGIGDKTTALVIGDTAQGRDGQYVRLENSAASALIDRELDVSDNMLDWVDTRIIDISSSEVAEVEIIHPGGERLLVTKVSADQADFDLVDMPQDREKRSSWAINSLGSVFSMLDMKSARPGEGIDWSGAVRMRLLTFSGMEIMAEVMDSDGEFLLRLNATYPKGNVVADKAGDEETAIEEAGGEETGAEDIAPDEDRSVEPAVADVMKSVEDINQKVADWVYVISELNFEAMSKTLEDLLKPVEAE